MLQPESHYYIQIEKRRKDKWEAYISCVELNSSYEERHKEDADLFFQSFHPREEELHDYEDGLYRVAIYHGLKVYGDKVFDIEDETLIGTREFTVKTEKRLEWTEYTRRL